MIRAIVALRLSPGLLVTNPLPSRQSETSLRG